MFWMQSSVVIKINSKNNKVRPASEISFGSILY